MPMRKFKTFKFTEANQPGSRDIRALYAALKKLRIPAAEGEVRRGEVGDAIKEAIKDFQRRAKIRVDGVIRPTTVAGLRSELAHAFLARSKAETASLHENLQRLGYELDADQVKSRLYGASTKRTLKDFQKRRLVCTHRRTSPGVFGRVEAVRHDRWRGKYDLAFKCSAGHFLFPTCPS